MDKWEPEAVGIVWPGTCQQWQPGGLRRGRVRLWSTKLVEDSSSSHELVVDGECRLKVQRNGEDVWKNIKIPPFQAGQVLQKGEMFRMTRNYDSVASIQHPFALTYVLYLQHDCNLVQRLGTDADAEQVVWSSKSPRPAADGCYLYLDKGHVALYEGTFDHSLGLGATRAAQDWRTPTSWMNTTFYSGNIQESYELLVDSDGSIFHWR